MRQIFLDTETTGLYPDQGHRVIEIAAVEMINRRLTKNHFHVYINPERAIDAAAKEVHGITEDFLQNKPLFSEIAQDFLAFITDAELVIHNAPFDVSFLNMEFGRIGCSPIANMVSGVIDTLRMAKEMRPGQRNNLDALCRHYGVDNSKRTLHGALLDAELLAEVYMAMTRGQESLMMALEAESDLIFSAQIMQRSSDLKIKVQMATEDEMIMHAEYLEQLDKMDCVWKRLADA